jgi:hypothetical protein
MAANQDGGREVILAEVRKTRETAERIANGESPKAGADDLRVVAGLVHQLAEQVERLVQLEETGSPRAEEHPTSDSVA